MGLFRKKKNKQASQSLETMDEITTAEHGGDFRWPCGFRMTAIEPMVLRLPRAAFAGDRPMEEVLQASDDAGFHADDQDPEAVLVRLVPDQWAVMSVSVGCQLFFDSEQDGQLRITGPDATTG